MSCVFKRDSILQSIFSTICIEGREDELRDEADLYHMGFDTHQKSLEFGFNLGEFVGKFYFGDYVYELDVPECNAKHYFIGSYDTVRQRLLAIL